MALTLIGSNGLFTRIGRLGGLINSILNSQGAASLTAPSVSIGVAYTNLLAQFTSGSAQADVFDKFYTDVVVSYRKKASEMAKIKQFAQAMLIRQVNDDVRLKAYTVDYALAELIRQMAVTDSGTYVTHCTVGATAPTASTGNTGTAKCVSSKVSPHLPGDRVGVTGANGADLQFLQPETLTLKCTSDAQTGGATARNETFSVLGQPILQSDPLIWDYTSMFGATAANGSGASSTISVCNAAVYEEASGSGGNLLYNGDFASVTGGTPARWVVVAGTPVTDFDTSAGTGIVSGTPSLQFKVTGTAPLTLTQTFNSVSGTESELEPDTVYAINLDAYKGASATGTVVVDLVDGSNTVIADNNGVDNTFTFTVASLGTSYGTGTTYGFFRTPRVLPTTIKLRLRITVAIATEKLYLGNMAMKKVSPVYTGGGYVALFSGATASILGDSYSAIFTNDFGGLTNKFSFQWLFNLLFDMRTKGFTLPHTGSTAINDNLIA